MVHEKNQSAVELELQLAQSIISTALMSQLPVVVEPIWQSPWPWSAVVVFSKMLPTI